MRQGPLHSPEVAAHTDDMAAVVEPGDDEEPPQAAGQRGVASAIAGVGDKQAFVGRELRVDRKPRQPERPTCKIEDGPVAVDLQPGPALKCWQAGQPPWAPKWQGPPVMYACSVCVLVCVFDEL